MSITETAADPQVIRGVVPYIAVSDANAASAFYQRAFGAVEVMRMPAEDGKRLIHCHLTINGGALMINDGFPEQGHPATPLGSIAMMLNVDDIDAWWSRAVAAGATEVTPVQKMFWGARYGELKDPFGIQWSLNETANGG